MRGHVGAAHGSSAHDPLMVWSSEASPRGDGGPDQVDHPGAEYFPFSCRGGAMAGQSDARGLPWAHTPRPSWIGHGAARSTS